MLLNNIELNILINGRKVDEFKSPQDFQSYIEGRDGSNFEIELVNNNAVDCEIIVSVDGLSVLDGKPAGDASGGYIVPKQSRSTLPGWIVDGSTAAKFAFSGATGTSYAEQSEAGDAANKGVIAIKAFGQKYSPPQGRVVLTSFNTFGAERGGLNMRGMSKGLGGPSFGASANNMSFSDSSYTNSVVCSASATLSSSAPMSFNAADTESVKLGSVAEPVQQTLGTGFGEATSFATKTVQFERGDLLAMIVLYYDDRKGLKARGIDVTRKEAPKPNPFPADAPTGCKPPANWSK